jgi:hypothetical protein
MIDKLEQIRQFMLLPSAFTSLLGGSYVAPDAVPQGFENTHPLVVVTQETGDAHVSGATVSDVIQCKCFGGSADTSDARAVFSALYDMFLLPGNSSAIKQVFYLNDFPMPDPVTGWPAHIGRFQIVMEN